MALAAFMAVGCLPEEQDINVDPAMLQGLWQKNGTHEYWRYRADGTGVTWDATPDPETGEPEITEEESNLTFEWEVEVDELTMVFRGSEGNQAVPKVYTIKSISDVSMSWRDNYGMTHTFDKVFE